MLPDAVTPLLPALVATELEELHGALGMFTAHRAVWLDRSWQLWHAKPDAVLENRGHVRVGTFLRPSLEELSIAVARALPSPRPAARA